MPVLHATIEVPLMSMNLLDEARSNISRVINCQLQEIGDDPVKAKISKILEEANEVVDSYNKSDGTLLSEMDDLLFVLLGLYDLQGESLQSALCRQVRKHSFRIDNGYDYVNKIYPNEVSLERRKSEY